MKNNDDFAEFLKKKSEKNGNNNVNWEERKLNWLNSIDTLYNTINVWLSPFVQQNLIKITNEKKVNLTEEYLGKYSAKRLDIYVGSEIISLIPRGTLIMGSNGRIDMRGPKGEIMALEPEWNRWEFVNPAPTIKTWEMNEDSFKDMIQYLM